MRLEAHSDTDIPVAIPVSIPREIGKLLVQ